MCFSSIFFLWCYFKSQGQFEILSLSGMLDIFDNKNGSKRMGYFKVSLVDPNLHLLGGVVADKLIAASFVKVFSQKINNLCWFFFLFFF